MICWSPFKLVMHRGSYTLSENETSGFVATCMGKDKRLCLPEREIEKCDVYALTVTVYLVMC